MLIDWFTVGPQALNFLVLVWLLKRFLYHPILDAIDELLGRMAHGRGPGSSDLRAGIRLQWDRQHLWLQQASAGPTPQAEPPESP